MFRARRGGRGVVGPRVRHALRLLADGRCAEAGEQFGQLADRARDNGNHLRSAHLAEQAARAFLEAGAGDKAAFRAREAVQQFIAGRRPSRAVRALRSVVMALRSGGFQAQADALEQDAQARLAEVGLSLATVPAESVPQPRGHLPPACPHCGGPLRADEADWIDSTTAECPYCGSAVQIRSQSA